MKSNILSKTYKKIAYSPDTNEWTFCNRAPNNSGYCYRLDTMLSNYTRGTKFYNCLGSSKLTILEGADLLLKKMRKEKAEMVKNLKWLMADPINYKGAYEYCHQRGLAEFPKHIEMRKDTIKTWTKIVKDIKKSPEYIVYVLTK